MTTYQVVSSVRACSAVRVSRAAYYRPALPGALTMDSHVIEALPGVVATSLRWGFWKRFERLRLDALARNHNACIGSTAPCG